MTSKSKCEARPCAVSKGESLVAAEINQRARINAYFVQYDDNGANSTEKAPWRPVSEWENPVWGWVLINYANLGLQFFLQDGTFYREVRFGGPKGTRNSPTWLPHQRPGDDPNDHVKAAKTRQLDILIGKMDNREYLQEFVDMITDAMQNSPTASPAYAEFLDAAMGKPPALVNMGFSLELAADALGSEFHFGATPTNPSPTLTKGGTQEKQYEVPVKIGDAERSFDGLVAFFHPEATPTTASQLNLDTFYTFSKEDFSNKKAGAEPDAKATETKKKKTTYRENIGPASYPALKPFWIAPVTGLPTEQDLWHSHRSIASHPLVQLHLAHRFIDASTMDLAASHAKDDCVFRLGPLIMMKDVPDFEVKKHLSAETYDDFHDPAPFVKTASVGIPPLQSGDWAWMQPYPNLGGKGEVPKEELDGRAFAPLPIYQVDENSIFEDDPYTVVKGYLQLRKPIETPSLDGKNWPDPEVDRL
ncbi:hypothetical protein EDB81DRAFT_889579 [Dactylonectria macrodidyma]|uniref:Uncharacterized protein n=1 Tax=Dactylonectria macrodidyma TaxID=307937 RepID=A0A9P9INS3_9HYPO|nr:hypothetical protein EDB81DRAFT_889579 [Dactylonectria macrodidyma]